MPKPIKTPPMPSFSPAQVRGQPKAGPAGGGAPGRSTLLTGGPLRAQRQERYQPSFFEGLMGQRCGNGGVCTPPVLNMPPVIRFDEE